MADFSLRDLWWLRPKEQDNPLPALQLGVSIAQRKAQQDLQERQLANEIAVTSLRRDEMMYKQKLQTSLVAGNAAIAEAIASVDDWTDPEQVQRVYEVGAQYPMVVGSKAWQGAEYMQRNAITARRLEAGTQSLIESRRDRAELNALIEERRALLADSTIDLNDARIRDLDSDIAFAERRTKIQEGNLELRREELSQKGRRLSIRNQRMYDNELKALNEEEKAKLSGMSATSEEADRLRKLYNLKRRGITEKFYGADAPGSPPAPATTAIDPRVPRAGLTTEDRTTNAPPAVAAPAAPMPSTKADLVKDQIYQTPRGRAKWDGEKFIPQ